VTTYPYTPSGQGALVQTFVQLRKGFPSKVNAGYLKRFNIASSNESYIISILRFLDLIDEEGDRRDESAEFFFQHGDEEFRSGLEKRLRVAYSQVFDEMREEALTADKDALTGWFRAADKTSALVGQRQAATFQTLVALAGHGDVPASRAAKPQTSGSRRPLSKATAEKASASNVSKRQASQANPPAGPGESEASNSSGLGLTVRIEINLPPTGDAETYDAIFASIKKHLMT
jgi:hypothetical protein